MTIAERNRVLTLSLAAGIAMAALSAAAAMALAGLAASRFADLALKPVFGWEPRFTGFLSAPVRALAVSGALGLWGALCGAWILRAFRKTASYEILFFALFASSLSAEALRSLIVLCIGADAPAAFAAFVCRAVYACRWLGTLSLFAASLYAVGMKREKAGRDAAIVLFLSILLASIMPLDSGALTQTFLYRPGYGSILALAWLSVSVLCLADYLIAAFLKGSRDHFLLGLGLLLAMVGRDLLLFMTDPLICAAGLALLSSGGIVYMRRCFKLALWQ